MKQNYTDLKIISSIAACRKVPAITGDSFSHRVVDENGKSIFTNNECEVCWKSSMARGTDN